MFLYCERFRRLIFESKARMRNEQLIDVFLRVMFSGQSNFNQYRVALFSFTAMMTKRDLQGGEAVSEAE